MKTHVAPARERTPRISVVVPTFRRPVLLRRCLDALLAQRIDPEAFEIIVVDDGSDDCVRDLVLGIADWIRAPQVRYLRPLRGHGPAAARNRGWRAAKGVLIAFTDDDAIPTPGWLMDGARAFESNRQWVALSGRVVKLLPDALRLRADHHRTTRGVETAEFVAANAFVWRAALEAVGGFDERFTRAWRDDSDLQFKLLAQGAAVGFCPEARVVHPVRAETWRVILRQQRNTYFDALLYKKHPRLYRERIRRVPPWDYYLVVALGIVAPLAWLVEADYLAAGSAAVAAALVLRLARQRLRRTDRSLPHLLKMLATSALIPFLSVYWRVRGALRFRVLFL
jgi:GT2 family glycosyltransferase